MARTSTTRLLLGAMLSPLARAGVFLGSGRNTYSSNQSAPVMPPSKDPWYTAPQDFERTDPGTVLRWRQAPGNISAVLGANCSAVYDVLYRTTNSLYQPDWAVTKIFVPASSASPPALLSYQVPYDSASLDSSPSYAIYGGDGSSWLQDIATGMASGWVVSLPDYEGPKASFTAGVQSGHATIDSVRAVLGAGDKLGLGGGDSSAVRYAMWGYSGGALASEWAAELAVQYAPELSFSGAALGGLTPNVTSVLLTINGNIAAGLIPPSVLGIASQYPELKAHLLSRLKQDGPHNATGFLAALDYSLTQAELAYLFQDIGDYFVGGLDDLLGPLATAVANRDGQMGYHGVPQMPLYVYKAIADEVSPISDTDALVERYCGIGANIVYERNTVGGHSAHWTNGRPAALAFLTGILGGVTVAGLPASGCAVANVSVNITDSPLKRRGAGFQETWLHFDSM